MMEAAEREARRAASYPPGDPCAWYAIAGTADVGRAPVAVDLLGETLVVFRDAEGQAVVFDRRCPHLGADLSRGPVRAGRLVCPFHHWEFDGEGHVCHIPAGGKVPRVRARRFETREAGGLIFLWRALGGGDGPPAWDDPLGGTLEGMRPVGGRVLDDVPIHIVEIVENSVDTQHFLPLHSAVWVPFTRWAVPGVSVRHEVRWERDPERSWVVRFQDDAQLWLGTWRIPRSGAQATVSFVGPGAVVRLDFLIPDLGRITLLQTQTPRAALRQQVFFRWFAEPQVPSLLASYVVGSWYSQWLVDVDIWSHKFYVQRPALVAADGPVHDLRRWYQQFFEGLADG